MAKIIDIEGIGPAYAEKLHGAGIRSTAQLLRAAGDKKGRAALAEKMGVAEKLVLEWVNRADLFRVKGVGTQWGDLLEQAGVDSPAELAQRRADNLAAKMREVNATKKLVRQLPSDKQVAVMIESAKALPKVVTY